MSVQCESWVRKAKAVASEQQGTMQPVSNKPTMPLTVETLPHACHKPHCLLNLSLSGLSQRCLVSIPVILTSRCNSRTAEWFGQLPSNPEPKP